MKMYMQSLGYLCLAVCLCLASGNHMATSVILKFLVSNHAAGSIIGPRGRTIADMQELTGAHIKLSPSKAYFPGTVKRVVMLSGARSSVEDVFGRLLEKINEDAQSYSEKVHELDVVVPNNTAGMIIGKGGETIRTLQNECGVRLKISDKQEQVTYGLQERRVLLTGNIPELRKVVGRLLDLIECDPMSGSVPSVTYSSHGEPPASPNTAQPEPMVTDNNSRHSPQPYHSTYPPSSVGLAPATGSSISGSTVGSIRFSGLPPPTATVDMPVPEPLAGEVFNSSVTQSIEAFSGGAMVHLNGPHPTNKYRYLTITGTFSTVQTAAILVRQRVVQEQERSRYS